MFQYSESTYSLAITDPNSNIESSSDDLFLTISLGQPYKGSLYKLIAAIIRP